MNVLFLSWNCSVKLNKFIFELDGVDNDSHEEPEENEPEEREVNENVDE